MTSPVHSPEKLESFPGNHSKSNYSLKLWLCIAWVGFLILPWYAAYDGFWSFIWITDGYPTFDEYSPGILQITMHQRWWLWPIALSLLVPLPALILPRTDPRHATALLLGGGFGFAYTLAQGFILGLHGWGWVFLGDLFGPTGQTQIGMGYGALLVCGGFLFLFTQGLAARGAIKGDVFVSGTIG
ncbi:MAG: iron ABC transporter permease, partial [SAR324 cluster bacterium]